MDGPPYETPFTGGQNSRTQAEALLSSGVAPVCRSLPSGLAFAAGCPQSAVAEERSAATIPEENLPEDEVIETANDNRRSKTSLKRIAAQSRYVALFEGCGASRGEVGLALIDVHRPYLETSQFSDTASYSRTVKMLELFRPDEILLPDTAMQADRITQLSKLIFDKFLQSASIVYVSRRLFNSEKGLERLERVCAQQYQHVNLELRTKYYCVSAANALMNYVECKLGVTYVDHSLVVSFEVGRNSTMIDPETLRCLEVLENSRGQHQLTLFGVLNQTVSLCGARLLRSELTQPLLNIEEIKKRHEAIDELLAAPDQISAIRRTLKQVIDIDKPILLCVRREHARLIEDDFAQRMILNGNYWQITGGSQKPPAAQSQTELARSSDPTEPCLPTGVKSVLRRVPIHRAENILMNMLTLKYMLDMVNQLRLILENLAPTSKWLCEILEAFRNEELLEVRRKLNQFLEEDANFERERLGLRANMCFALKTKVNSFVDMERCAYVRLVSEVEEYVNKLSNRHQLQFQLKWTAMRKFHLGLHEGELLSKLYGNNADYEIDTPQAAEATEDDPGDESVGADDAVVDHQNGVWSLNSLNAFEKVEKEARRLGLHKDFIRVSKFKHTYMFTTAKLLCLNEQINRQLHDIYVLSSMVLESFIGHLAPHIGSLLRVSESIAMLDLLVAFAHICTVSDYTRPTFDDQSKLEYKRMRHPILDKIEETNPTAMIANDLMIDCNANMHIIFGANMTGKSTYLKQVALLQIMAQIGCYVPAEFANVRLFDQIFTRISFDDRLESCESTFTTEVIDVKYIMDHATSRSLVLIDEFGRSTSHEEGLALCFAILEKIALGGTFTLAATHFHELAVLENMYDNIVSYHFPCKLLLPESTSGGTTAKAKLNYSYVIQRGRMPPDQDNYGILLAEVGTNLPASMIADAKELQKRYLLAAKTTSDVRMHHHVDTVRLERENLYQKYAMRLFEIATRSSIKGEELKQFLMTLKEQMIAEEAQLEPSSH